MPQQPPVVTIERLARRYRLDPRAVKAVARTEGGLENRDGDIGDLAGGGSYGPFQLYAQGALPRELRGRPRAADTWAWSPQGIDYALRKMAEAGAGGLTGRRAVDTIVRRFERPADPDSQVAKALAFYGGADAAGGQMTGGGGGGAPGMVVTPHNPRQILARALLERRRGGGDRRQMLFSLVDQLRESTPEPAAAGLPSTAAAGPPTGGSSRAQDGLAELFYDPLGSYDQGRVGGAIGGHDRHVHGSFTSPQATLNAIRLAQQMGLTVRENPYVDPVDPVHTKGSFHYRTFPGQYDGRQLGQGIDVSGGTPQQLAAYYRRILGGRR